MGAICGTTEEGKKRNLVTRASLIIAFRHNRKEKRKGEKRDRSPGPRCEGRETSYERDRLPLLFFLRGMGRGENVNDSGAGKGVTVSQGRLLRLLGAEEEKCK